MKSLRNCSQGYICLVIGFVLLVFIFLYFVDGNLVNYNSVRKRKSVFRVALPHVPNEVRIAELPNLYSGNIAAMVTEGLFEYGEGGVLVPGLASKYTIYSDKLIIHIADKRFHDGSEVLAEHVIKAFYRCLDERKHLEFGLFSHIKGFDEYMRKGAERISGFEAIDRKTVSFAMKEAVGLLIHELTQRVCNVVNLSESRGDDLLSGAIGTGPYRIIGHSEEKVSFRSVAEGPFPEWVDFVRNESGEIGGLSQKFDHFLSEEKVDLPGFNRFVYQQLGTHQLVFNNSMYPFKDRLVRKAVSLAVDKTKLAEIRKWPKSRLQKGLVPYGMRGFRLDSGAKPNIDLVTKLLGEAGYTESRPLRFSIALRDTPSCREEIAFWKTVFSPYPIEVTIEIVGVSDLLSAAREGNFEAVRIGKDPGSHESYRLFESYQDSSVWNTPRASIASCQRVVEKIFRTSSSEDRYRLYEEADRCLIDDNNILLPLSSLPEAYVYIRKPWKLSRKSRFLLYPRRIYELESESE